MVFTTIVCASLFYYDYDSNVIKKKDSFIIVVSVIDILNNMKEVVETEKCIRFVNIPIIHPLISKLLCKIPT